MASYDEAMKQFYDHAAPGIEIGHGIHDGTVFGSVPVRIPLKMLNRHGLIAGSTGTGKTRTLQVMAEQLSAAGVPTFVSDVKGDLSGLGKAADPNPKLVERMARAGRPFQPSAFPLEFYSLTGARGIQVRATVSSFGPLLLAKVLDLSKTQRSVLSMVFQYCDDRQMPLLDFADLRTVLQYLGGEGKKELADYGSMSPQTMGVLIRKMVELEQQGAERFFGEPELDVHDLMRTAPDGRGIVNVLDVSDVQAHPRLFSTFLMWLLGRFYHGMPEVGDPEKPRLVFFFDEAHLLFDDAEDALLEQIELVARLIRSKGIGVFFITQTPKDVKENVLAQLGNRIQHSVRAFTPTDAKNVRATASTFPKSEFVDVPAALTQMGIGEALVSILNPKGAPTPAIVAQISAPSSSMEPLPPEAAAAIRSSSTIAGRYAQSIDRESAHEMIGRQLREATEIAKREAELAEREKELERRESASRGVSRSRGASTAAQRGLQRTIQSATNQAVRTAVTSLIRGVFGMLRGR